MARQLLDVDELEPLRRGDRADRVEREVGEVLVVDGVVLEVLDELREVRELERRRPIGREQLRDSRDEVVDVGHLGQDVVAQHEIGAAPLRSQAPAEVGAEELGEGLDAALDRRLRDVQRRLHAEHRDALRQEVLQEVAVVGRDLDDEAPGSEPEPIGHLVGVAAGVLDPRVGVGGEVRVLGEDVLGGHELRDLDEPAALARANVQRVEGLALLELLGGEHRLAERRLPEVDDGQRERRAAVTARRRARHCRGARVRKGSRIDSHSFHSVCDRAPVEG